MKWARLFIVVFMMLSFTAEAQWGNEEDEPQEKYTFKDKLFFGGGLGLNFGNNSQYFSISPLIGYKVTSKLATGLTFQYRYSRYKSSAQERSTNDIGVTPFVRYNVYSPIFLHTEYEYLASYYKLNGSKFHKNFGNFMAGAGLFQSFASRAGVFVMVLYNFSYQSPLSPYDYTLYTSPWVFRAGITAGF